MDFSRFRVLTFDCYGTLIDWETGLLGVLQPLLKAHGVELGANEALKLYSQLEPEAENPYKSYRDVLAAVVRGFGTRLGFTPTESEARSLAESLPSWKPFPDTIPALRRLKATYRLGIISNVDDDLFGGTARLLQVPFDTVTTAQQAGEYKPSLKPFELALSRVGARREQVLHVAESLFHDVAPARTLGLSSVWVNRRAARGTAASRLAEVRPDLEVINLGELADAAGV